MRQDKSFISFENVTKSYDGEEFVVKNLNLSIDKGQFVTLLGPSGSGKTTCLMMLAGFEDVTSGEIYFNGKTIKKIAPHKRGFGMIFQNYALFPHMTVGENLAYPLKFRNYKKNEIGDLVARFLELVELPNFKDRYPTQLSGGQQQRVSLARALIYEPELILMDEPLGALDKNLREQLQYEIKRIHELLKITVIYVTHDQTEAITMSDRIAIFNEGLILQDSSPKEIYEKPKNKFVAEFVGENNSVVGKILSKKGNLVDVKVGDNVVIKATPASSNKVGSEAYLTIRPENIILGKGDEIYENQLDAKITKLTFLGDHTRISVNLVGTDVEFIAKVVFRDLSKQNLEIGSKVKALWKAEHCLALEP